MEQVIIVEKSGDRLDKFLSEKYDIYSRSQVQKLIKSGKALVNKKVVTPHYKLKENDKIYFNPVILEEEGNKEKDIVRNFEFSEIEIIDDNDEYLVINKPAGLIVHGGDSVREITLVDLLLESYPGLKKIGEDPLRPGIVHRIDKEVSGLMVIAKTQDSFDNLKNQFQKRTIKKEYTALVYGSIQKEKDEINFPIKRSTNGFKMAAMPITDKEGFNEDKEGVRRAITDFQIIQRYINYTLLKVKIKTGRTHQIRVHMLAYGHPIVGDNLYNTKKTRELNDKIKLNRIFLAATSLAFSNLSGQVKNYEIKLPDELTIFLEKIK